MQKAAEDNSIKRDSAALAIEEQKMTPIRFSTSTTANARGSVTEQIIRASGNQKDLASDSPFE